MDKDSLKILLIDAANSINTLADMAEVKYYDSQAARIMFTAGEVAGRLHKAKQELDNE